MRITLFGAGGQLGQALNRQAALCGHSLQGYARDQVSITDREAVANALRLSRPDLVINAAAYTAVDKAESEPEKAMQVNRDGVEVLSSFGLPLMHVSTDYVFDGMTSRPYDEDDTPRPLSVYGRTKAEGEVAAGPNSMIIRTSWVFGIEGANFVKTMLRLARERDVLRVVDDQRGCPTFADDLAQAMLRMAQNYSSGIYHLAGSGETTWHGFAREIFRNRTSLRIEPITTAEYPTPARRPANSVLNCSKAQRQLGIILPPWQDGLERMLEALT